jgi:type IV secretory pathway TrbL component
MDWASLVGSVVLLGCIALVLQLLWRLLLGILVFGPPSYSGVIIGHFVGDQTGSAWVGFLCAIAAAGLLGDLVCASLRNLRRAH